MKERQRWQPEEDALLRAYVKQYGPRDWHLLPQRMNKPLNRDSKSCLERWKNYLKPGIKKGSLTEDEQRLVVHLQAKHGNKWKKIATEIPGRTAKRLGKWWEVFKEKQQREQLKENGGKILEPIEEGKYNRILETFAEKLVKERASAMVGPNPNSGFIHAESQVATPAAAGAAQSMLPPWMASSSMTTVVRPPPSPSVTLTLSPSTVPPVNAAAPVMTWLQPDNNNINNSNNGLHNLSGLPNLGIAPPVIGDQSPFVSELVECCRELEEGHRAWAMHRKESAWRLKRVELQLESEKACRRREKVEEIEAKIKALMEEQKASLDRIDAEYREQLAGLRREAEVKEQKLAEQWAAKHLRLSNFVEQMGYKSNAGGETHGR